MIFIDMESGVSGAGFCVTCGLVGLGGDVMDDLLVFKGGV
jgi:hypothetical protein